MVGIKSSPPFTYKDHNGKWAGIVVDLWETISEEMEISYEYKEYELTGLFDALRKKEVEFVLGALTITKEREKEFDFTHAFFTTGIGIAVPIDQSSKWITLFFNFFSYEFLQVLLLLLFILMVAGGTVWYVENKNNTGEFPAKPSTGIFEGIWWAAVTMTTVGYGDRAPRSTAGKVMGLIWMFTSVVIISSFTASIASSLTVSQLGKSIRGINDLRKAKVGTVKNSTSSQFLDRLYIDYVDYINHNDAINALLDERLDALVYDIVILQHKIYTDNLRKRVKLLPKEFDLQYYGILTTEENPKLEEVNIILLTETAKSSWKQKLEIYLGAN